MGLSICNTVLTIVQKELWDKGINLITNVRRNMKQIDLKDIDKILLRKRSIIGMLNEQLKNIEQLEHSRHRSLCDC